MRIIAGVLGGRHFDAPVGHRTHPMSDKARGGLFNILGDIAGMSVLDAFAGSGGLGLEAISRGAKSVVAIDIDNSANTTIVNNVKSLGLQGKIKPIRANVSGWSANNAAKQFGLVLADPPFDKLQLATIEKLTLHLKDNGTMVLNWPGKSDTPQLPGLMIAKQKPYGDTQLVFYRRA